MSSASAMRRAYTVLGVVIVLVVCGGVAAGFTGSGPLAGIRISTSRLTPQAVHLLGEGGDPDVVMVGVRYAKDGYCSGQFTVRATESATEVRIDDVVNREVRFGGACAGLGTANGMAWAELRLAAPLGQRRAIRASDGIELPVS